jgi:putative endonuclease
MDRRVASLLAMTGGDSPLASEAQRPPGAGMKQPAVYIVTNRRNGTLYTGVTSDLAKRIWQHRQATTGFTARYGCKLLVWYELHGDMEHAILREKQIKAGSRADKLKLIQGLNPGWRDLFEEIVW